MDPVECKCACHYPTEGTAMMHCFPCCDGRCDVCGKWFHGLKEHKKTHEPKKEPE